MRRTNARHRGSSPLARGPHWQHQATAEPHGLIPARAGTTDGYITLEDIGGAHPRSRGDHLWVVPVRFGRAGSSPLARGPRVACRGCGGQWGLIPARAGTTWSLGYPSLPSRAHPRSRGDHIAPFKVRSETEGSSPLARGPHLLTWGFTPYISKIESL